MVILYGGKIRAAGTANELLADSRHTLIRAPRLDEATIRAIDETLHRVQGVGIERVEAPRQTLENLFLDIVERARQEQLATSGAQSGGRIASFLQGDEANAGEATESGGRQVVEALVQSTDAPARATLAQPAAPAAPKGVDASMLDALVSGEKPAQSSAAPAKKPDAPQVRKAAEQHPLSQKEIDELAAAEAAKKADKEAAEAKKKAQKEAKKKADMEAAKAEAKKPPATKKAEKEAAEIAERIADLKRHRVQIRCAIQNLNPHDFAKSQTFEALIKFEASWQDRSPILHEIDAAGYKLGDRIVKEKCTYNKLVILQHDGSENSELFTPRITFKNRAKEPKTKEELYVAELPLMTTDSLPDDQ
jgi:hypothetical protein